MNPNEERYRRWLAAMGGLLPAQPGALRRAYALQCDAAAALASWVRSRGVPLVLDGGVEGGRATLRAPLADLPFPAVPSGEAGELPSGVGAGDPDALQRLFHAAVPRAQRRAMGAFHTPAWVADLVLTELDGAVVQRGRLLDPGCGSGAFLAAARRVRLGPVARPEAAERVAGLLRDVQGVDLDPLAVAFSRLDLVLDLHRRGLLPAEERPSPVAWGDSILGRAHGPGVARGPYDALVGNPPWLPWSALAPAYRDAIRDGVLAGAALFDRRGFEARLGHANDDLLGVFTLVNAARHLAPGGQLALVVKRGLFGNVAGSGFRRLTLSDTGEAGDALGVTKVLDLSPLGTVFEDAREPAAVLFARRGEATRFPVRWLRCTRPAATAADCESLRAVPRGDDPGAAWDVIGPDHEATSWLEGHNAHEAEIRHGLKHDAEGVFALEVLGEAGGLLRVRNRPGRGARAGVERVETTLEAARIFPYVKCRHLRAWTVRGHGAVLVPHDAPGAQDPETLAARHPHTGAYLARFRRVLEARRSSVFAGGPYTAQFAVGPYSWRRHRVAWCSMAPEPGFAVVSPPREGPLAGKPVVVDGACYAVSTDDEEVAHYLCALLGSAVVRRFLEARRGQGKRWLSKANVARVGLPAFDAADPEVRSLSGLSQQAHRCAEEGDRRGLAAAVAELDPLAEAHLRRRSP